MTAVDGIDLGIRRGEVFGLLGPWRSRVGVVRQEEWASAELTVRHFTEDLSPPPPLPIPVPYSGATPPNPQKTAQFPAPLRFLG
ncbi:hypothetical protein ACFWXN_44120, partial [Streptomyces sp. NPDC058694]